MSCNLLAKNYGVNRKRGFIYGRDANVRLREQTLVDGAASGYPSLEFSVFEAVNAVVNPGQQL